MSDEEQAVEAVDHDQLITVTEVSRICTLSSNCARAKALDPSDDFPEPIRLSPMRLAWYRSEVLAWIATRPRINESAAA